MGVPAATATSIWTPPSTRTPTTPWTPRPRWIPPAPAPTAARPTVRPASHGRPLPRTLTGTRTITTRSRGREVPATTSSSCRGVGGAHTHEIRQEEQRLGKPFPQSGLGLGKRGDGRFNYHVSQCVLGLC